MTSRRFAGVLLAIVGGSSLVGCDKLYAAAAKQMAKPKATAVAAAKPAPSAQQGSAEAERDSETGEKINLYISCLNGVSDSARHSRSRYLRWADEKRGPVLSQASWGFESVSGGPECTAALEKAKASKPALPEVDAVADAYQKALSEFLTLTGEVYKYYDQHDYNDDKLAKGKAMHAPLLAGFDKFFAASDALDEKISKLNDELSQRRLARLSKDPDAHFPFLIEKTEIEAKTLVKSSHIRTLKELDLTRYSELVETYGNTVTELEGFAEAHKDQAGKVSSFSSFLYQAKEFGKHSKDLMRRKRDNKEIANSSTSSDGHPARVMEAYNSFIKQANSLRFN